MHFESIQRISDTTTLPYAMHYLRSRVSEDLDLSPLTEKLIHGKGQSSSLPFKEKLELWERLKILSMLQFIFAKMCLINHEKLTVLFMLPC